MGSKEYIPSPTPAAYSAPSVRKTPFWKTKKGVAVIAVVLAVVIAIVVGVSVGVTQNKKSSGSEPASGGDEPGSSSVAEPDPNPTTSASSGGGDIGQGQATTSANPSGSQIAGEGTAPQPSATTSGPPTTPSDTATGDSSAVGEEAGSKDAVMGIAHPAGIAIIWYVASLICAIY